ncbi:hypothetical protein [uncultured Methanobrevibacter sp.]|uniref:hypothetical protein n=1 Tax=uncultured Methanobrevibacter sp. TaxID=253161 RepID=UPI0025DB18AA|nr:hypothetical protein [uncultured Methanobrevibacter sp.]
MNFMNNNANIKQFQLIRFINDNCSDDHVITKISIVLRRDKIEAPYYLNTKIRLSTCVDMAENGIIHAMDIMNHNRMHNLTEDAYNEIKSLIDDKFENAPESDLVKTFKKENQLKIVLVSRSDEEINSLFDEYHELFDKIDNLVD